MPTLSQPAIRRWMLLHLQDGNCIERGEVNCTQLAENAAHHFEHDEWLDDPDHPLWDLSLEAAAIHEAATP